MKRSVLQYPDKDYKTEKIKVNNIIIDNHNYIAFGIELMDYDYMNITIYYSVEGGAVDIYMLDDVNLMKFMLKENFLNLGLIENVIFGSYTFGEFEDNNEYYLVIHNYRSYDYIILDLEVIIKRFY